MTKNRNNSRRVRWLMNAESMPYMESRRQWAEHKLICTPDCPPTALCKRYRDEQHSSY